MSGCRPCNVTKYHPDSKISECFVPAIERDARTWYLSVLVHHIHNGLLFLIGLLALLPGVRPSSMNTEYVLFLTSCLLFPPLSSAVAVCATPNPVHALMYTFGWYRQTSVVPVLIFWMSGLTIQLVAGSYFAGLLTACLWGFVFLSQTSYEFFLRVDPKKNTRYSAIPVLSFFPCCGFHNFMVHTVWCMFYVFVLIPLLQEFYQGVDASLRVMVCVLWILSALVAWTPVGMRYLFSPQVFPFGEIVQRVLVVLLGLSFLILQPWS